MGPDLKEGRHPLRARVGQRCGVAAHGKHHPLRPRRGRADRLVATRGSCSSSLNEIDMDAPVAVASSNSKSKTGAGS